MESRKKAIHDIFAQMMSEHKEPIKQKLRNEQLEALEWIDELVSADELPIAVPTPAQISENIIHTLIYEANIIQKHLIRMIRCGEAIVYVSVKEVVEFWKSRHLAEWEAAGWLVECWSTGHHPQQHIIGIQRFTCMNCQHKSECASAFDHYNTNGDCLESK